MAKDTLRIRKKKNKNKILVDSKGKLVICTDNAMVEDGKVSTDIQDRTFEISGTDVLRIQAFLAEKKTTCIHTGGFLGNSITYVIVGENAEYKEAVEQNVELNKRIEDLDKRIKEFNKLRHWWERKLKV